MATLLRAGAGTWLKALDDQAEVTRFRFSDEVLPAGADSFDRNPSQDGANDETSGTMATDLAGAMEHAALNQSVEAVILVTDGGHNVGGDPLRVASSLSGLPFYVVPIGRTDPVRDVILHHVQGPRTVFRNDRIVIDAMVDAHGCEGERLRIELLKEDAIIDRQEIAVVSDSFVRRIHFEHTEETIGMHEYHLRVQQVTDERSTDNNAADVSVEVTEDEIRVLLVDHFPRWEFRYLRNLFKRDDHIVFDELQFEPPSVVLKTPLPVVPA